ncbi:hypothetical protein IFM89_014919 [Coptis chinensis]|uniref:Uncharacterized protein n=1 Tax=Coptis chinensis TaxID=261450 RepID=A0A835H5D5_9MAGN|nr:hypothetical protein IFM89_014919 [Coptis chinensis]
MIPYIVLQVAALSVALFRALKLTTRFVSILDVASLKPITGTSGCSSEDLTRVDSGLFDSSTPMVTTPRKVSVSPLQSPSHKLSLKEKNSCGRGANEERLNTIASKECNDSSEACRTKSDGSKRKGDLEFELQLEMAAFATAYGLHDKSSSQMTDWSSSSTQLSSPSNIFKRIKTEKVPVVSQGISTAVGSRKRGAPLYWAEVFCGGENLTGKWVHVDAVNSIIGGEETVEAATSACKRTLRYVIAFAGNGAKDVTRRYCTKWYKIASQRINPHWWDAVLGPLRELESRATGGLVLMDDRPLFTSSEPEMVNPSSSSVNAVLNDSVNTCIQECSRFATRSSLEDMELQTRALTEPLPTNQQAYSNHHLYCIERWLSKYEMLRPKESSAIVLSKIMYLDRISRYPWILGVGFGCTVYLSYLALLGLLKNERGQVDVWSEKCLPLGTVHLRLPRVVPVAKRLEIDFAPAMVGFEFRNGRSVPVYEGIVVCSEFNDAIIQAYAEEEEKREAEEKRRDEAQAISRWYQLLSSVITRQRLRDAYGDDSTSEIPHHLNRKESACGMQVTNCEGNNPEGPRGHAFKSESTAVTKDHEHIFPVEDQTFDEESSVRTKRCPCGFLVQVEEL